MGSINQFLQGLGSGLSMKDYQHASKIFVDNNYNLSPKYGFLFHVAFDFNSQLSQLPRDEMLKTGLMVKTAQLPKYTVDTKTLNAYNRVNIVQNKLKYDPIQITFHDDSADVVRDFWYDYLSYYYRDTDYSPSSYTQETKYTPRQTQQWGYTPSKYSNTDNSVERIIQAVRLYSLHQKRFSEYVLINPTITSFQHGQHQQGENNTMEHTMTLSFETVLYNSGYVDPGVTVNGFATLLYDKTPSPLTPLGGSTNSILGPGGLLSAVDGVSTQLGRGNLMGAGLAAYKAFTNFNGKNLGAIAGPELMQIGTNILQGSNPLSKIQIPSLGGLLNSGGAPGSGGGLLGSLLGGQTGGISTPTGATAKLALAATAGTAGFFSGLFKSKPGSSPETARQISSNGDNIGGTTGASNPVPAVPIQRFDDGSYMVTDPTSGKVTIGAADGSFEIRDNNGAVLQSYNSQGILIEAQDPTTGKIVTAPPIPEPVASDSQQISGDNTTMNDSTATDMPTDQGSPDPNDNWGEG